MILHVNICKNIGCYVFLWLLSAFHYTNAQHINFSHLYFGACDQKAKIRSNLLPVKIIQCTEYNIYLLFSLLFLYLLIVYWCLSSLVFSIINFLLFFQILWNLRWGDYDFFYLLILIHTRGFTGGNYVLKVLQNKK